MRWLRKIISRAMDRTRAVARRGSAARPRAVHRPSREEVNNLPPFDLLGLEHVLEVNSSETAAHALGELSREHVVGFDTESRPTFAPGEISRGPHVVQFASRHRAFVFVLHQSDCRRVARELITSAGLKKVGFGLEQEWRLIPIRLRVRPQSLLDLETIFAQRGYGRGVGIKTGVAIAFKKRFAKPKRITTSNWSRSRLSPEQLRYAANDAWAALRVYYALH